MPFFGDHEAAKQSFLDYGYFSLPFQSLNGTNFGQNSKVISLNTNFCYDLNWQASKMFKDPGNMLEWLQEELQGLEDVEGTALIIAHVPNLDECNSQFGKRMHAILDRY